jgi:hypothetical protein
MSYEMRITRAVTSDAFSDLGNRHAVFYQGADARELRARDRGHRRRLGADRSFELLVATELAPRARLLINSSVDPPWSQYFCCMLTGNAEFVRQHPVVTKRVVRAVCKSADLCASEPRRVAQVMDRGFAERYDYALQTLNEVPYSGTRRDYDPSSTYWKPSSLTRVIGFSPRAMASRA